MLASLRIRNLALVEDLSWEPGSGLVAITGETGAGKSILIGALQLLLGDRADKSLIRTGTDSCTVEAVFDCGKISPFDGWLEEQGAEPCAEGQLLLKRTLSVVGAGRQFINGSASTLATLKALGDRLVDLHGPHDHQSLFSREAQTRVLDAFAGATVTAEQFAETHRLEQRLAAEVGVLREVDDEAALRREILSHTADEINAANFQVGEEEDVMSRLKAAGNSQRLTELAGNLQRLLGADGEGGVRLPLASAVRTVRELVHLDPHGEKLREEVEAVAERISDLEGEARTYGEGLETNPASLRELEERADLLQSLKRKYGGTIEEVMARGEEAMRQLEEIVTQGERLALVEKERSAAEAEANILAKKLSAVRAKAVPALVRAVTEELRELGFLRAAFGVSLERREESGSLGAELAEFEFGPNPGEPAKPLRSIASSGEISRVMLALKTVLAGQEGVPVLVFDEIDANVGGEVAVKVGQKMRRLSNSHQVLCITHLPQVAAAAHRQFVVAKDFDGTRTTTQVSELTGAGRVAELARMLGGQGSNSALAHARSLLQEKD